MSLLDDQIKKLEEFSAITPRIAYLFKMQFLEIESPADSDEMGAWFDTSEANEDLFLDVLDILKKFDASYPLEQRIKDLAAYAKITPRAIELLFYVFVKVATDDEKNEVDDWMHECTANDRLFDVLLELDMKKDKTKTIHLLQDLLMATSPNESLIRQTIYNKVTLRLFQSIYLAVQESSNTFSNS
jgi:hypothetical protein